MRGIIPILLCIVLTGCAGPRCRISVANIRDEAVSSAKVHDHEGNTYEFTELARESRARYIAIKADLGKKVPMDITDGTGTTTNIVVQLDRYVKKNYEGRVVFQLEKDGKIRPFVLPPDENSKETDLSWSKPENWEGTPNIPGMTGED